MSVITWRWREPGILQADTITKLPPEASGAVVVSGSHGGRYPGFLAARAGARAVILNDAGVGRDGAGIGSLAYLEALGIAAACVSHLSCLIGDTGDMLTRGTISHANGPARSVGVRDGMACADAAALLREAPHMSVEAPTIGEARREAPAAPGAIRRILLLDSASLVQPDDAGQVVVTGSHGGLIGGDPALALRVDAFAAAFSDAGRPDGPGTARLPALERRGIAAVTVSAASARIGDAASVFADGLVSALNGPAEAAGVRLGARARDVVGLLASWPGRG